MKQNSTEFENSKQINVSQAQGKEFSQKEWKVKTKYPQRIKYNTTNTQTNKVKELKSNFKQIINIHYNNNIIKIKNCLNHGSLPCSFPCSFF